MQLRNAKCYVYDFWPNDKVKTVFGIVIIFLQFLIPFKILVFCYAKIIWMLTRRIDSGMLNPKIKNSNEINPKENQDNKLDTQNDAFQTARRNSIKTLLIVGCCYIICWSQNQFLYLIYNFGYEVDWNSNYFLSTVLMVFLNSTINPFIYLFNYRDYQNALKKLFVCNKDDENENQSQISSSLSNSRPTITASI